MTMTPPEEPGVELERFELAELPRYSFSLDRRAFLQASGVGLIVALVTRPVRGAQDRSAPNDVSAWLHLAEDGRVTVFTGKVEVGQNIRTSLSQAVAEELRVPVDAIDMVMGDTARTPFDQGTFGSRTTPFMAPQLRRAAAAAREILLDLAAEQLTTERSRLDFSDGVISDRASGKTVAIGELTRGKTLAYGIPAETSLTPAETWRVLGRSVPKVQGRSFVDGTHLYTSDLRLPEMLEGKVIRPPVYGARVRSVDDSRAKTVPGAVVIRDGDFVGVTAPSREAATKAADLVTVVWDEPASPVSNRNLFSHLRTSGGRNPAPDPGLDGALAAARHRLDATYTVDYIAHAPMEPRAALAQWEGDRLTVWTGTQRPFGVRDELVRAFRIPDDKVRVLMPDAGSGYGGKHTGDAAVEAARLAKAAGKPVRLVWTREEEFSWAYFRPAGVIEVRAGVDADGKLLAWDFHNFNSGGAAIRTPYVVSNPRTEYHPADSPLRQGSYRALAAAANNFARESHMNELATLAGIDPLVFRLRNLSDTRMKAVLQAGAEGFGWLRREGSEGRGHGLSCGFEKGGYLATFAEVELAPGGTSARVTRVTAAFECGAVVNPVHLESQVTGCIIQGIGGALFEGIRFEGGKISNGLFSRYRVPRFSDVPEIRVILLDRKDLPSAGGSETPIIGIAPTIAAAVFDAGGGRRRSLPMFPS